MTTLHTINHPHTTMSILNWMLNMWEATPDSPLLVITRKHDGVRMNGRLRVRLSQLRHAIRAQQGENFRQFGFESTVISWTDVTGEEFDALCVQRKVQKRHKIIETLARNNLLGSKILG